MTATPTVHAPPSHRHAVVRVIVAELGAAVLLVAGAEELLDDDDETSVLSVTVEDCVAVLAVDDNVVLINREADGDVTTTAVAVRVRVGKSDVSVRMIDMPRVAADNSDRSSELADAIRELA